MTKGLVMLAAKPWSAWLTMVSWLVEPLAMTRQVMMWKMIPHTKSS